MKVLRWGGKLARDVGRNLKIIPREANIPHRSKSATPLGLESDGFEKRQSLEEAGRCSELATSSRVVLGADAMPSERDSALGLTATGPSLEDFQEFGTRYAKE
jgi:hypothetical protein